MDSLFALFGIKFALISGFMSALIGKCIRTKFFIDRHTKGRSFRKKCRNPMAAQWSFLRGLLERHQETDFGRKHSFSEIRNLEDFREKVPIQTWDDMAPYVEQLKDGNLSALFPPSEKMIMFAETSGTTNEPKYIPVTRSSYDNYKRCWDLMWSNVLMESPKTFDGKILYFPGDPAEGDFNGIPYGAISAKCYTQQNRLIKSLYPYPYDIVKIKDYQVRYYTIMRLAVESQISIIAIANPSTILTLFKTAQENSRAIIEDIRMGQLRYADQIPSDLRSKLFKLIRPNPRRANKLKAIQEQTGDFLPKDYWAGLSTIMCFRGGPLGLYIDSLKKYLLKIPIFDIGLLASEARFSFPISSKLDGCCLTIESNFFEFIPEDQIHSTNPEVLTLDQCERGKRYFIVITNASGLYRYNISDLVEVTGFYENVPLIKFCNKGKHMSSITGEKLTEFQVTESVRKAEEKVDLRLEDFTVCLHWDEKQPSYSLITGSNNDSGQEPGLWQRFINQVEEELMQMNVEYKSKRESLRLGPMTLKIAQGEEYESYENSRKQNAHNLSQYKHVFLVSDPAFEEQFHFNAEIPSTIGPSMVSQEQAA